MRTLLSFLLALSLSSPSQASNWMRIDETRNHAIYYLDVDGVRPWKAYKSAWLKIDRSRDNTFSYDHSIDMWLVDCARRSLALKSSHSYSADGAIIRSDDFDEYDLKWQAAVPESVGETILDRTCAL